MYSCCQSTTMNSDDSNDSLSDGEFNTKGPRSPSASSQSSQSGPASPIGPQSPTEQHPMSPAHDQSDEISQGEDDDDDDDDEEEEAISVKSPASDNDRQSRSPKSPVTYSETSLTNVASINQDKRSKSPQNAAADDDDGNSTDSSDSSCRSSNRKIISKRLDSQAEAISDGEMESDEGKASEDDEDVADEETPVVPAQTAKAAVDMSHQDLSDVSDLESIGGQSDEDDAGVVEEKVAPLPQPPTDLRQKIEDAKNKKVMEKTNRLADETEEQLDFEAEDGECTEELTTATGDAAPEAGEIDESPEQKVEPEELEEGELSDEDDARPEETEPRPVCRFFSRGQCTWGASCRFLHPGVTDKGNYTMFELIRPVVGVEYRSFPASRLETTTAPVESAWERALRSAKEMVRKSIKRKEQDMDFEEKKMNLTLAQAEFDKENGYYTAQRVPSPEPARYVRHPDYPPPPVAATARSPPEEYYGRRQVIYEPPEYVPREKMRPYRELPSHRMPDYYNNKYEEEAAAAPPPAAAAVVGGIPGKSQRHSKPKREVIVQRVVDSGRGDEWADPWMRSKSPGARGGKGPRKASYSSGSSYSSSR